MTQICWPIIFYLHGGEEEILPFVVVDPDVGKIGGITELELVIDDEDEICDVNCTDVSKSLDPDKLELRLGSLKFDVWYGSSWIEVSGGVGDCEGEGITGCLEDDIDGELLRWSFDDDSISEVNELCKTNTDGSWCTDAVAIILECADDEARLPLEYDEVSKFLDDDCWADNTRFVESTSGFDSRWLTSWWSTVVVLNKVELTSDELPAILKLIYYHKIS